MSLLIHLSKVIVAVLLISTIPPNVCQLALASSSYISFPSALRATQKDSINIRGTRSKTLFTKYSELKPRPKANSSAIEREIAAIFKGVAYGSETTTKPTTKPSTEVTKIATSTAQSTTAHRLKTGITEHTLFIGRKKEVFSNVPFASEEPESFDNTLVNSHHNYSENSDSLSNTSAFTYFINSERYADEKGIGDIVKPAVDDLNNDVQYPTVNPTSDNGKKEVQVRITSVLQKQGFDIVQEEVGKAWGFHVYLTGIFFGIVAALCLLSLSRVNTCCNLIPRGYYVTLHLMIFFASFLRCLLFLHDPYGAYSRLPSVLKSMLFNTVDPCLTTAYAMLLMVLLRAAKYRLVPLNMQSPLFLTTICGIHIGGSIIVDVTSGVLEDSKAISSLNITVQIVTISWGALLCLGYVASFSNVEKAAQRQKGDLARLTFNRTNVENGSLQKNVRRPSLTYSARIFLICTLLHGLLIAFIILNLVTVKVALALTPSEAWAWWTQASLERLIEIVMCILLLATSFVLTQAKSGNQKQEKNDKIFSIFSNCGRGAKSMKNVDVYPVATEKCNILANGTITRASLNGSINYQTGGWKQFQPQSPNHTLKYPMSIKAIDVDFIKASQDFSPMQCMQSGTMLRPQFTAENGVLIGTCLKDSNLPASPLQSKYYPHLNNYSHTLSGNNYYCSNQDSHVQSQINCLTNAKPNSIQTGQNQSLRSSITTCSPISNAAFVLPPSDCKNSNYDNEYEVAPYYVISNGSSSCHTYSKPYTQYNGTGIHNHAQNTPSRNCNKFYRPYDVDPKSEMSIGSSHSEIHVDYLTDISSSNDGLGGSLSRTLTLPLSLNNHSSKSKTIDSTPDSAVGLDYSPQPYELKSPVNPQLNAGIKSQKLANGPFEIGKVGHPYIKEAVNGSTALLGKMVSAGSNLVSYAPLSLDDTCTSSYSSDYASTQDLKKSTSTGDLTKTVSNNSPMSPVDKNVHNVHKPFHPSPVTCL